MEFNKEYWIEQLKKEVGLMEIPYDQLVEHEVELASPTGRSSGFKINAKEYVDRQLGIIQQEYDAFALAAIEEQKNVAMVDIPPAKPEIVPITPKEIKPENIRFFDVDIHNRPFTIIFHDDKTQDSVDYINLIHDRRFFVKERKREDMTGMEQILSIYQYINAIADIPLEPRPLTAFEEINTRMDTIFDGLKLQGII